MSKSFSRRQFLAISAASAASVACRPADFVQPDIGDASSALTSRHRLLRPAPPPPPPPPPLAGPNVALLPSLRAINRAGADMSLNATYRAAAAGTSWLEPATGVRIVKVTDASFPAPGTNFMCPYAEGGPFISRRWDNSHTVNVHNGNTSYLIDVSRSGGASGNVSNPRQKHLSDVDSGFSYVTSTPTRMYHVSGSTLYAFDARNPASPLNLPNIPSSGKNFSEHMDGGTYLNWLTVTENDEWLVFQCEAKGVVIAYNLVNGTVNTRKWEGLNQPQAVRHVGDNWVILCSNTYRKTGVWNYRLNTFIENTRLYSGHPAPIRGGMVEFDPSFDDGIDCFTYDASTNTRTQRAVPSNINAWVSMHKASQWINGTTQSDTWFQSTAVETPRATLNWSIDRGNVYKAPFSSLGYGFNTWDYVVQGPAGRGEPTEWNSTLSKAASRAAMVEGSWFSDIAAGVVYVWTLGGVSPTDVISMFGGQTVGVAWHRADASDARLVCHTRSWSTDYYTSPFGTMSPDGLAVMFSSNMGVKTGRVDVYMAILPER